MSKVFNSPRWVPPDFYAADEAWQCGYPYELEGVEVTVFLLGECGWSWMAGPHCGRTGFGSEEDAKRHAVACLSRA